MKELIGKELDIVDAKTQRYISTVKFLGMNDASNAYPLNCIVLDKFEVCGIDFNEDNFISFDKDGFWRGKSHPQANEFDMRLVIPQKGNPQNVKDILVEAYAEGSEMKELIGKRLTVYCSKTKKPLTSVKVFDVDTTGVEYPIQCTIITPFNADGMDFKECEVISFNANGYWRGKLNKQSKDFDMQILINEGYIGVKDILVEAYEEGIIDVVHDVKKALKLVMPHLESGKLTLEMLNRVIRRAYEN